MPRNPFKPAPPTTAPQAVAGQASVSYQAAQDLGTVAAHQRSGVSKYSPNVTVFNVRKTLTAEGIRAAAASIGKKPPSDRTIRRWIQQDRIPDAKTAQALQRAAFVERNGGLKAVANKLGRSESTVRKWQKGQQELKTDAAKRLKKAQVDDLLRRRKILDRHGAMKRPRIRVKGSVTSRIGGSDYSYKSSARIMNFSEEAGTALPDDAAREFVEAMMDGDHARALAILEAHASLNYGAFDAYGDGDGFHFTGITDLNISWGHDEGSEP